MTAPMAPLHRLPDAAARLRTLLLARRLAPFAWGSRDCALWAADVVQAVTGVDVAADLRGRYATARGALLVIRQAGGLQGLAAARLAGPAPLQALADGDVVLLQPHAATQHRGALAVHCRGQIVAQGADGLVFAPRNLAAQAWRCAA